MDSEFERACGAEPSWICETAFDLTGGNRVLTELIDAFSTTLFIVIIAFLASFVARRHFGRVVARVIAPDKANAARQLQRLGEHTSAFAADPISIIEVDPRREARYRSISVVVGSTTSIIIWSIAGIMALGQFGIDLAPLIAGAGIAGVALGFGAQSLVKDCIAGLFMLIEDQYGVGDVVDLDEATGVVEEISLRTTVLRGLDGTVWHVPNGQVTRVGNKSQLWSVALIDVDVAYDCDLAAAREVILEAARTLVAEEPWSDIVLDEPQFLGVEALAADGITMRMTIKVEPGGQWALQRALREAIKAALDDAGIEIPFPQRTLWIRRSGNDDAAAGDVDDLEDPSSSAT